MTETWSRIKSGLIADADPKLTARVKQELFDSAENLGIPFDELSLLLDSLARDKVRVRLWIGEDPDGKVTELSFLAEASGQDTINYVLEGLFLSDGHDWPKRASG